jgi:formylglycine-generating enzyme required for sulfatase activity
MATLKQVKDGDTVLVYIACHGGISNGQSHLCPRDFDHEHPGLTHISVEHLRDLVQSSKGAQKLVVLDACHSGGSAAVSGLTKGLGGDISKTMLAGGMITFAAASSDQSAMENKEIQHGLFTYSLAQGLGGAADRDKDGIVESDELYAYVFKEVCAAAEKMGGKQTPVRIIGGDVIGIFALARVAGEAYLVPVMKTGQTIRNSLGMEFALVMPTTFRQGSPADEAGRDADELADNVTIGRAYLIGRFEVTQAEYAQIMGKNPSWFAKGGGGAEAVGDLDTSRFPVEQVSWEEATAFCEKLSALPEEVKAGSSGNLLSSKDANVNGDRPYLDSPDGPNLKRTTTVGSYAANPWGLYDMHGNVWEWVSDWYMDSQEFRWRQGYMDRGGPKEGTRKSIRGGAYSGDVALCRSASRKDSDPEYRTKSTGFRVVCTAAPR